MNASKQGGKTRGAKAGKPARKRSTTRGGAGAKQDSKASQSLASSRSVKTRGARVKASNANGQRSCTITHSELLAVSTTQTSFDPAVYALNPGQSRTFPWLSVQAEGWERFRFKKLEFEYLSRVPATKEGVVTMGCDYDAADEPPDSELELMAYQNAVQDAIWKNQRITLSPESLNGPDKYRYIRTTFAPPSNTALLRQDDAGKLYVQVSSTVAEQPVGSLIVHYTVELITPQLISGDTASNVYTIPGTGNTFNNWLGSAVVLGSIGLKQTPLATGTRNLLTGLIPGQLYRLAVGAKSVAGAFTEGAPFSFAPEISAIPVGLDYINPTGYNFIFDFASTVRDTFIDFLPGAGINPDSGSAFLSAMAIPNPDPVE